MDIRGVVKKTQLADEAPGSFSTDYVGLKDDYLDVHIPGAAFVDWTKARRYNSNPGVKWKRSTYTKCVCCIVHI